MTFALRAGELRQLGGKALALLRLEQMGLPVPAWFVVPPAAFEVSATKDFSEALATGNVSRILAELNSIRPSDQVLRDIHQAISELDAGDSRYAVRSSAVDEDGSQHSFAGQLETFLFVSTDAVPEKVIEVWRSGFSERVMEYRRQQGLAAVPSGPPAVLVQQMVNATASGVAFSADPVSGRRSLTVVSAVPGLGTALVGGEAAADVYKIDRSGKIVDRQIATKNIRHQFDPNSPEGVSPVSLSGAESTKPALSDDQAIAVTQLARQAAHAFGQPQDVEWAIEDGRLYLLQSRPITTLRDLPDPDGALNLWDNSNITESYNGVTTPLTFSFARYVYDGVYRQFCRLLRVPESKIAANQRTFSCMLGLIRGRVYYNLLNWYRVLSLLPGFKLNRRFMEQMMGVRESLPDELAAELGQASARERALDALRSLNTIAGLISSYFSLNRQITKFYARLNLALAEPNPKIEDMRLDELVAHYYKLEQQLLSRWDAPLVNDFFAMIFHGGLRKLSQEWCGDENGMLANDAIRGQGEMISLEPARRVRELAAIAARHPELATALREAPLPEMLRAMQKHPEFVERYEDYLNKFGDRCLEELKLESETLRDNPMVLLRNIGEVARVVSLTGAQREGVQHERQASPAIEAEKKMLSSLSGSPVRRSILLWTLRQARERVRNRENLRFERTRLFGTIRRIMLEAGRRLHAMGGLDDARDVFYLELPEILAFSNGTATTTHLRALTAMRKQEFAEYATGEAPDDRFETRGPVYHAQSYRSATRAEPSPESNVCDGEEPREERKGLGCCPGVVRGRVCVVRDPKHARLFAGCILVADHTDPGWIMLFPSASGLLVERGSLLSHSAIVARELGIPAVISIPGLLQWLQDGDEVELDGSAGIVRRLCAKEANA